MSIVTKRDSNGDHVVQTADLGFAGVRKDTIRVADGTGKIALEGKDLGLLHKMTGFTGRSGAGAVTLASTKAGDVVLGVINLTTFGDAAASFESTISVAGQIQQSSASNLSAANFLVLLLKRG